MHIFILYGGIGNQFITYLTFHLYSRQKLIKNHHYFYIPPNKSVAKRSLQINEFPECSSAKTLEGLALLLFRISKKFSIKRTVTFLGSQLKVFNFFGINYYVIAKFNPSLILDQYSPSELQRFLYRSSSFSDGLVDLSEYKAVLHYRDYANELLSNGIHFQLSDSYYYKALQALGIPRYSKICVLCEAPPSQLTSLEKLWNIHYYTSSKLSAVDIITLASSMKAFIMANSTLSWVAAIYLAATDPEAKIAFPDNPSFGEVDWGESFFVPGSLRISNSSHNNYDHS